MERLKGKVAVVTGAGSGIGKVLARRLASDGASVVVADLQRFDEAAAEIAKDTGARTLGLQIDVSNEQDVMRMATEAVKAFERIDVLVNNAAVFSTPSSEAASAAAARSARAPSRSSSTSRSVPRAERGSSQS